MRASPLPDVIDQGGLLVMSDVVPKPLPPALLARLERELTDALLDRVRRFAETRVELKRRLGIPCYERKEQEAEIMVQDAITATVLGQRAWNPEIGLYDHLCGVVRSESSTEAARATRRPHTSVQALAMDESHGGDAEISGQITRSGPAPIARPAGVLSASDAARRSIDALRVLARGEPTVTMLLDAYQSGCVTRKDVMAVTGMSADTYRNARRKLDRMNKALPDNLSEGVQDALEISYDF